MAQFEGEDLFYVYPEFHEGDYEINIVCMDYSDLTLSKTTKLNEVYKSDEIADYLDKAKSSLWFLDDKRLFMSCIERSKYDEYAILK